jgi:hypothetical protein
VNRVFTLLCELTVNLGMEGKGTTNVACRVQGSVAGLHGCAALLVGRPALARLAALLGTTELRCAPGHYLWARLGARGALVVVRLLPLPPEYAERGCGRGDGTDGADGSDGADGADGADALPCWLSDAAACSLGLGAARAGGAREAAAAARSPELVLLSGPITARAALPPAASVDVSVAVVPGAGADPRAARASARAAAAAPGVEGPGAAGRADASRMTAAELSLVSDRLVPIVRANLAAQIWSEGMSTRASIGATALCITIGTVRPRPGAAAAPSAFAKVVLFDQHTAVSVTVTTTPPPPPSAQGPSSSPSRPADAQQPYANAAVAKWVREAGRSVGGVSDELLRAALLIYSALAPDSVRERGGGGAVDGRGGGGAEGGRGGGGAEGGERDAIIGIVLKSPLHSEFYIVHIIAINFENLWGRRYERYHGNDAVGCE